MGSGTGSVESDMSAAVQEADIFNQPVEMPAPTQDQIARLEIALKEGLPNYDIDSLTSHHFCEGLYARELLIPKDAVIVGKRHAKQNFFLLVKGEMTVSTNAGMRRIAAPFMVVTQPGDKRVAYAHEDCITMNFHANQDDCTDMAVLENRYIIPPQIGFDKTELIGEET